MKECYKKAVAEPYGHLLICLDPKPSDCLRFRSTIVGPEATCFTCLHHKIKLQKVTISAKNLHILSFLEMFTPLQQQEFLKHCEIEFLNFCCECAIHIINGTVPVSSDELEFYKQQLKTLCKKSFSSQKLRNILMSKKGLKLLNLIYRP